MFKGIITPIVTPFNRDEAQSINYEATKEHIERLLAAGVQGIFALGSNGEFHVLTHAEKTAFVEKVVGFVDHRVPVFAGAGACSTRETVSLAQEMEQSGADALSVVAPYFIKPTDAELVEHYQTIAASVNLPVILYNIPKNTGYSLPPAVVEQLAQVENIVGIKDSSGDLELLQAYTDIAAANDFQVLIGSDSKISVAYQMGAKAAIAGTSNLLPKTLVALDQALAAGEYETANQLQGSIDVLRKALKLGTVPAILKRSIELSGLAQVGPARKPVTEPNQQTDEEIVKMLEFYR
ncbi:N-acetylneuraminate lyase [Ligilactobacillus salitolerans]|uniref:4-hydroxy-tetrahydrodipicolinate synthase n=1 Tax=Ligilactobacillus salitolerans TaxID=1808352 RepID=A0A401IR66_9LACO|nr:4-hydroxy-tetrahydrodipicolinate synthase [Ligilactobacillus salitolerans]GBG94023.1 N-acetylneuraminate lyase [Ligilactobacillus salitolerans]